MRASLISAALVALVSSVVAQTAGFDAISSPTLNQNIPAGSSFDIVWAPGSQTGTVSITLLQGADPGHLVTGPVIASSIDNSAGKFTWSVPTTSAFATYGFAIVLDSTAKSGTPTLQYSFPFHITGGSSSSSAASASSSVSASSGSASGSGSSSVASSTGSAPASSSSAANGSSSAASASSSSSSVASATITSAPVSTTNFVISIPTSSGESASVVSVITGSTGKADTSTLKTATKSSSVTGTSSTGPANASSTGAASNIAAGGLAMVGGLLAAFAL